MKHAHKDKGGNQEWASQINAAKQCLTNSEQRTTYNQALSQFGIADGHALDQDFNSKVEKKINPLTQTPTLETEP